jgi:hypothetical protein
MTVDSEPSDAGLRPCAPARGKPRQVFLSRSPFPPWSGANGARHAESATRDRECLDKVSVPASRQRIDQTVASPRMPTGTVTPSTGGVGCPARKKSLLQGKCDLHVTQRGGYRSCSAAHHWHRSALALRLDYGVRLIHSEAAHSQAQRARKESPRGKPRRRFSFRFAREAARLLRPNDAGART